MDERRVFIESIAEAARAEQRKHRLFASVTIAQAALESAWGQSKLAREAHNLFGIKGVGPAGYVEMPTWEVVNGQRVQTTARFRRYNSRAECIEDRSRILTTLSRYRDVLEAGTPELQSRALQECGWATDPQYGAKLLAIILQHHLTQYDLSPGPFPDVPGDHWAAGAIAWAKARGLMAGYPDGAFRPEAAITRAELAAVLERFDRYLKKG